MGFSNLLRNERGVSPVIGIILVVAITVILAAVIGSFVLGIGGDIQKTPTATLNIEHVDANDGDRVNITHNGGETLDMENLNISHEGKKIPSSWFPVEELGPSQTISYHENIANISDGDTVSVVHNPSGGLIVSSEISV